VSHGNATLAAGFARAIVELAMEPWLTSITSVYEKLVANPEFGPQLDDKAISFGDRQKQLDTLLPNDIPDSARNFFYTLVKEGNVHILDDIRSSIIALMTQSTKIEETTVTTAVSLTDAEKEQFEAKLRAKYGENLDIQFRMDPQIVGGVVVQIGDKILDGSLAAKINAVETSLKSVS